MSDERCWLETRTGFSGTFCSVQKPSGNAVPLCGSNANCLSDPNEPQACCPHPSVPEINTCQSGCGKCGNTCIVGLCDTNYGLCGDSGTGVCPPPCNAPGGGSICCWNSDTPTARPTCSMLENCGVQAGTIRLDCNDSLDCVYNPGPGSVCCLAADPGLPQQKLAACVSGPGECQRRFGLVVCASDADCSDTGGGSQQACRPYANSTIIHVCQ